MNLTIDQRQSLQRGEPIRIAEDGLECVILRADVFEQIRNHNGDDWTTDEMRALALRTFEDSDTAGPIP